MLHMDIPPPLTAALEAAPRYREQLRELREILLATTVMAGEIPAPSFGEEGLVRYLMDRYTEAGLQNVSTDEMGNATGILPGTEGRRRILVCAHTDKIWESVVDHTVNVHEDRMIGPGLADNALGVAMVATLPLILERLGLQLKSDLILLGTTRSMGRGNLEGLRFFLENFPQPITGALCLEGIDLGRLSYTSLGLIRADIAVRTGDERDWLEWGHTGALVAMNRLVDGILAIETPRVPRTSIVLGSLQAGSGYGVPPQRASLKIEIRSEQPGMVGRIHDQIAELVEEINAQNKVQASFNVIARRRPGDIGFSHPLVRAARAIMGALEVKPVAMPATGELSALLEKNIPSLTLGLTTGDNKHQLDETIHLEPLFTGLAQVLALLQTLDGGLLDEQD